MSSLHVSTETKDCLSNVRDRTTILTTSCISPFCLHELNASVFLKEGGIDR